MLAFVGDLFVEREEPLEAFGAINEELHAVDLLFGNVEAPYTNEPHVSPSSPYPLHGDPKSLPAFKSAGFSVV
jgi:poly-gamma-glutamate synthesis protein (capsule biosynthesis protein)